MSKFKTGDIVVSILNGNKFEVLEFDPAPNRGTCRYDVDGKGVIVNIDIKLKLVWIHPDQPTHPSHIGLTHWGTSTILKLDKPKIDYMAITRSMVG